MIELVYALDEGQCLEMKKMKDMKVEMGNINTHVCQQNAMVITKIFKSLYSCKNIIYKGRRQMYLQMLMNTNAKQPKPEASSTSDDKLISVDIKNIRVCLFDSTHMEK